MMVSRMLLVVLLALGLAARVTAAPQIKVEGLMPNAAVLTIDGQRKMLKVGQEHKGVKLVASGSSSVTLDVDGRRVVQGLSTYVGTVYEAPSRSEVTIARDASNHYVTNAQINGRSIKVMLDTGATLVSMSEDHADALGIDYFSGTPSTASTASGIAKTRIVTLNSVSIGGVRVNNVVASVVEGSFPSIVLLGMSFLEHFNMAENSGILTLTSVQ